MSRILPAMVTVLLSLSANAKAISDVTEVGPHHRLFRFDKSENPQNVLYAFTKTDESCRFRRESDKVVVDFYWMLDGTRYKKPHSLIRSGIASRIRFEANEIPVASESDAFSVRLVRSEEMKAGLDSAVIRVASSRSKNGCDVTTVATFEGKTISLSSIEAETKKTWRPPFRKIVSITLRGSSVHDGHTVARVFD